jgi:hypothetical protein
VDFDEAAEHSPRAIAVSERHAGIQHCDVRGVCDGGIRQTGPPQRDTLGMATSLGRRGWREPSIGAFIAAPAALDVYRYFRPDDRWAVWASRGSKAVFMALVLFAGRPVS